MIKYPHYIWNSENVVTRKFQIFAISYNSGRKPKLHLILLGSWDFPICRCVFLFMRRSRYDYFVEKFKLRRVPQFEDLNRDWPGWFIGSRGVYRPEFASPGGVERAANSDGPDILAPMDTSRCIKSSTSKQPPRHVWSIQYFRPCWQRGGSWEGEFTQLPDLAFVSPLCFVRPLLSDSRWPPFLRDTRFQGIQRRDRNILCDESHYLTGTCLW